MKLSTKIFSILGVSYFITAIFVSTGIYFSSRGEIEKQIGAKQHQTAKSSLSHIDSFLYERFSNLKAFSYREQVREHFLGQTSLEHTSVLLKEFEDLKVIYPVWKELALIDVNGKEILSANSQNIGKNLLEDPLYKPLFKKALSGETVYSDVFISEKLGNVPTMVFMSPVRDKSAGGKVIGVVEGHIDWAKIIELLGDISDEEGETHIFNKEGFEIASNHKDAYKYILKRNRKDAPYIKESFSGKEDTEVYKSIDYKENALISHVLEQGRLSYKGNGWIFVVENPTRIVFAPAFRLAFYVFLITIFAATILTFVSVFFLKRIGVNRLIALTNVANLIAGGELEKKADDSSPDELGQLAKAFNEMTDKLKQSSQILEQEVKNKTKELEEIIKGTEEKNAFLEDTKRAVINILEDSRELENNLQKFQLAAESAYEHIIITDEKGVIIYANSAVARTTGYTREEVLGKTPALWSGNMPKDYYEKMWDTIKTKKIAFDGEIKNKRKNGEEYVAEISISPILDENKNIKFYVGLERDVTKERNLTEELRKEKEGVEQKVKERTLELTKAHIKLTASISSLAVGFIMTDRENNIVVINQAARNILCASSASPLATIQGCTLQHIEDELKGAINLRTLINQSVKERKPILVKEFPFQSRFLKIVITPITELADVLGCVVLVDDITEEKILDRSKDEFFSIASHELRTPLTAIRGNTSLIKQYYGDTIKGNKDLEEMIDDIYSSSVRLIEIVNDFLSVSRLEQGKMEFKLENFDISELINKEIEEVGGMAKEKGLSVSFQKEELDGFRIYADKDRLGEVILNLLGNAIKYTEKGSITINISQANGFVKVSFADTGRGIPAEQQNLLFRKFQQTGESILTRDTTKGTGLGLYISKLMIDNMGGKIQLENSSVGNGSVFSFTIPVAKKEV
nr:PAS domain S-box protein [Candidatus Levybacteria bacterium]